MPKTLSITAGAVPSAPFVTIGNVASLTGERALTGTTNQVTVTDNGADSTVVLSLPQSIHTAATPTFAGLTLTGPETITVATASNTGLVIKSSDNSATKNVIDLQNSSATSLFKVTGTGIVISGVTYTTASNVNVDRMYQINATVTSGDGANPQFPRALFCGLTTAGTTAFTGGSSIIGLQGQVAINTVLTVDNSYGLFGRTVFGSATATVTNAIGLAGALQWNAVTNPTTAVCLQAEISAGTVTATNFYWFRALQSGSIGTVTNQYGLYLPDMSSASTLNYAIYTNAGNNYFGDKVGILTTSPTNTLSLGGEVARTIWMERRTAANTAGNTLTIQGGGATSGATDKSGGNLLLSPGASTGTGVTYVQIEGYTTATSTGTGTNTQLDREIIGAFKALTNNSAIALVNCTLASGTVVAGSLRYAVEVTDGTDYQVEEGFITYHVTNKAGTIANNTVVKSGNQQAATAGTLTVTFTITAANPAVIKVNANSSLTPSTGYPRVTYSLSNLTQQAIAIQ